MPNKQLPQNHCPLCLSTTAREIEKIPFNRIWQALEDVWLAHFSQEVIDRHTPGLETVLQECLTCGLQYFSPAYAGNDAFYNELTSTSKNYYSLDKWDFQAAAEHIAPNDVVLDIACGSGGFLKRMKVKGCKVFGIDTNPAAVDTAHAQGLPVHCVALADYAKSHAGCFSVVTAFQIIEHIPEVQPFIRNALTCLKPGGKLILTVPNRLRCSRDAFEPLDCPPHHLSRWTDEQFHWLAESLGCQIVNVSYEPATMHDCRDVVRRKIAKGRSGSLWARLIARMAFGPSIYSLSLRQGWLDHLQLWRMSVMCVIEKVS